MYSSKTTGPNFVRVGRGRLASAPKCSSRAVNTYAIRLPPVQAYEDTCAPPAQKFNIPKAVKSWVDAKFPANKVCSAIVRYSRKKPTHRTPRYRLC